MGKIYSFKTQLAALVCLLLMVCPMANAEAKWELFKQLDATHSVHITKSGVMLLSDYNYDRKGGIYYSTDKGATWTKAGIADYNYNKFFETDEYVFALGYSGRIARSDDEGKTWEILNYTLPLKGLVPDEDLEYTACYGMAYHKGKLFIGDFVGGGVLYSEDMGETWNLTDRTSLSVALPDNPETKADKDNKAVENIYNVVSFNGNLYAFGLYCIYKYVEESNSWQVIRYDSNFMAQATIFKDRLYCGRSTPNETIDSPFLEWTYDGEEWGWSARPEGQVDTNVRTIGHDDNNLYVGLQTRGMYYSVDEGDTWINISEGLPYMNDFVTDMYISPLQIVTDDEYIYVAMFEHMFSNRKVSGLYRMAKKDLPQGTGIDNLPALRDNGVYVDGNSLRFEGNATVTVTDAAGKEQPVTVQTGRADISRLAKGVYVYVITTADGNRLTGKFLKK